MKEISLKAIAIATVAMLLADLVVSLVLSMVLSDGQPAATLVVGTPFLFGSVALGTATTIWGGYLAARIAKKAHYKNATVLGMLCILFAFPAVARYPLWFVLVGIFSAVPAALLGGFLFKRGKGNT
jgi:hypothetical protein